MKEYLSDLLVSGYNSDYFDDNDDKEDDDDDLYIDFDHNFDDLFHDSNEDTEQNVPLFNYKYFSLTAKSSFHSSTYTFIYHNKTRPYYDYYIKIVNAGGYFFPLKRRNCFIGEAQ
jgi:hypothetical protein